MVKQKMNPSMTTLLLASAVLMPGYLAGCTSAASLSAAGKQIRAIPEETAASCESLGAVEKSNSNSMQSKEASQQDARNKVLNDAAARGGTHVVVSGYEPWLEGTCSNCVKLQAEVYRCDGDVTDMSVLEALSPEDETADTENAANGESNHNDHDAVCSSLTDRPEQGEECQYDTQCVVCSDGSACGTAVSRANFAEKGPECAIKSDEACEAPGVAYCCFGRCLLPD